MATIERDFAVGGIPRPNATAKLWASGAGFSVTPPVEDTPLPAGSPTATTTTGPSHGASAKYRFVGVASGVWYVSIEWDGKIYYDTYDVATALNEKTVKDYGAVGNGVTNDTAAIQTALNDTTVGRVLFPPGTYLCGNLNITNRANLVLEGFGATIQWTGTAAAGDQIGIRLQTSNTDIEIVGLTFTGDATPANGHCGVWWKNGDSISRVAIRRCRMTLGERGISGVRTSSGSWADLWIEECSFSLIGGVATADGAITLDYNGASPVGVTIRGCEFGTSDQYDLFLDASGGTNPLSGVVVHGNTSQSHRSSTASGALVPSISLRRVRDARVSQNLFYNCRDGAIGVTPVSGTVTRNLTIEDNIVQSPLNDVEAIQIGTTSPAADGTPEEVCLARNQVYQSGRSVACLRVNSCLRARIDQNLLVNLLVPAATSGIWLRGDGDGAGTANYSNEIHLEGNLLYGTTSGGSFTGFILADTDASNSFVDSIARAEFRGNRAIGGNMFLVGASVTNPNIACRDQDNTGLTYAATAGPLPIANNHPTSGPTRIVTVDTTLNVGDDVVGVNSAGAARTVTLPTLATVPDGHQVTIIKVDAGAVNHVVDGAGAETINGAANYGIDPAQWSVITVRRSVAHAMWLVVARHP